MPQKIVHRNIFHPFALLVALGILFAATNVKAQYTQFSQRQLAVQERQMVLTPEQEETIRLLGRVCSTLALYPDMLHLNRTCF